MVVEPKIVCPLVINNSGFCIEEDADIVRVVDSDSYVHSMSEIFDRILKVEKYGTPDFWFAPWDKLIIWLVIQEGLTALALRPEFIHKCMERLIQAYNSMLDQYEKLIFNFK